MIVEPELASRAAARATAEDISILRSKVAGMEANINDRGRQVELGIAFHDEIFRTAGNRVCRQMFSVIHRGILTSISRLFQRARLEEVVAQHKAIYTAISRREPEEARQRMTDHLRRARSLFLAVS
ncbi:MAG: FadR family transcriptional regulator [Acidimicrobiia bacterium]|nr:FadR family transcriptional regulator [Acidimicrobiia bacterium]